MEDRRKTHRIKLDRTKTTHEIMSNYFMNIIERDKREKEHQNVCPNRKKNQLRQKAVL